MGALRNHFWKNSKFSIFRPQGPPSDRFFRPSPGHSSADSDHLEGPSGILVQYFRHLLEYPEHIPSLGLAPQGLRKKWEGGSTCGGDKRQNVKRTVFETLVILEQTKNLPGTKIDQIDISGSEPASRLNSDLRHII